MLKCTYSMGQFQDPIAMLNECCRITVFRRFILRRDLRKHQRYNAGMPYVANLGAGRLMIAESPVQIERLYDWLGGHVQ